ncbi:MAG: glycosyl hydrolase family 8 [Candidatus Omnitrophota bacterium]
MSYKNKFIIIGVVAALILTAGKLLYAEQEDSSAAVFNFINKNFVLENGAVLIRSTDKNTVLSESVGLYLIACVRLNERKLFDRAYAFAQENLLSDKGIFYWRINLKSGKKDCSSASIDDLRIAEALCLAGEAWRDVSYRDEALKISRAILNLECKDGYMVDSFSWDKTGQHTSSVVNISYLDLAAMQRLAKYDPVWRVVYENSKKIILDSPIKSGLFAENYDLSTKKFSHKDGNMINQLLTALYLSQIGVPKEEIRLYDFLKAEFLKRGKICNSYNASGKPKNNYETSAVYALASRMFYYFQDTKYTQKTLDRMYLFEIKDKEDPFFGGFGMFNPKEEKVFNSFDSLNALLAITEDKSDG